MRQRMLRDGTRFTDYLCEKCNIVWYIGTDRKMHIKLSSTHSMASKLNDDDFKVLTDRIIEYERRS